MPDVRLECIDCKKNYNPNEARYSCDCSGLLDVKINTSTEISKELFESRHDESGVWRYKELVHPLVRESEIISRGEGNTRLYRHKKLDEFCGASIIAKHEGENPTGSFKDRGMTVGVTEAKRQKAKTVACASTGNTSASLASYAAIAGIRCAVFIPQGKIALGKLAQALAYGADVFQIKGDFDSAMALVQKAAAELDMYLLNSLNPWRLEGQKTIIFELIQQLRWQPPDWIAVPAGNLGNTSAFGKALMEMKQLGLIEKVPKIAAVQAEGANPFYKFFKSGKMKAVKANTVASAINIGNPVNWKKAARAIKETRGVVEQVSDEEIMDAKAVIDSCGIGCEPASAAAVAGARKLAKAEVIKSGENVACILTGHLLKDPEATIKYHLNRKGEYANRLKTIKPAVSSLKNAFV